jgi:hypothetical protein
MSVKKYTKKISFDSGKYIVVRDGRRVSDTEYDTPEQASDEYAFWSRAIVNGRDTSSKLEIVQL